MSRSEYTQPDHRWEALRNAPVDISPPILNAYGFEAYGRFVRISMDNVWIASDFQFASIPQDKKPAVFITGPSAAGKDAMIGLLEQEYPDLLSRVVTTTSRPMRLGQETEGKEYHFVSQQKFDALVQENAFIETVPIGLYWSGITYDALKTSDARPKLFRINPEGVQNVIPRLRKDVMHICIGILPQMRLPIYENRIRATRPDDWRIRIPTALYEMQLLGQIADVIIGNPNEASHKPVRATQALYEIVHRFLGTTHG